MWEAFLLWLFSQWRNRPAASYGGGSGPGPSWPLPTQGRTPGDTPADQPKGGGVKPSPVVPKPGGGTAAKPATTTTTTAAAPKSTIRRGSKGDDVRTWQNILVRDADVSHYAETPDGDFGPLTESATKSWQTAHGLTSDGVVGPQTWSAAGYPTVAPSVNLKPLPGTGWVPYSPPPAAVVARAWALLPSLAMGDVVVEADPSGAANQVAYRKELHADNKQGVTAYKRPVDAGGFPVS